MKDVMPTRLASSLTGNRLSRYKKYQKECVAFALALVLIYFLAKGKSYFGELLGVWLLSFLVWILYSYKSKNTLWQLSKEELKVSRREADKILNDAGIKNGKK